MEEILVILFSSVKFAMTFPLAIIEYEFTIPQTILLTNIGGIMGILLFAFLSKQLISIWENYLSAAFHRLFRIKKKALKNKKIFTKRNRRIIKIKTNYGLPGIAFATPVLFSIPVGVFLVVRYYERNKLKLVYIFGGNLIWSIIYSFFYTYGWQLVRR